VKLVFDASTILAVVFGEKGAGAVIDVARDGVVSSVNVTEILSKAIDNGFPPEEVLDQILRLGIEIVSFEVAHAKIAADLRPITRGKSISLADHACIALAIDRGLPIFTGDRAWTELGLDVEIRLIR